MPDWKKVLEDAYEKKLPEEETLRQLIYETMTIITEESTVIQLSSNPYLNIIGDLHGQFHDVRYMFEVGGKVPNSRYLFLGDYVDRGYFSLETITLLICLKVLYPQTIYLLRGNHECRAVTQSYGFYDECVRKFGHAGIWRCFMELFDHLPIAATVDDRIYCVHGGISPSLPTLDDIRTLQRVAEIPSDGPFADIMWSDPSPTIEQWEHSYRGAGYLFGARAAEQFLKINDLSQIVRAHQLAMQGYQKYFNDTVITVWSAPNYAYRTKNSASIMKVSQDTQEFIIFEAVPADQREMPPESYLNAQSGWE